MHPEHSSRIPDKHCSKSLARTWGFAISIAIATLGGCNAGGPDAALAQYLARLSRTLSVAPTPIPPQQVSALPSPRKLHRVRASSGLDMLDFLALHGCAVQVTIGKRNSSLGRLARDSQRLLLDLEYLQLAPDCIALQLERGDTALADTLEQAWNLKRRELPLAIYNATLAGSEYRAFWKTPASGSDYPANTSSAVISSLTAINSHARRWLAGDFSANNREFEILLGEVARGDGGALRQALAAQANALAKANDLLAQRMAQGPLCAPPIRPAAADILANVILIYFIQGIQPRAAQLNRRYHEMLPVLGELEQLLESALAPAYQSWRGQRDEELARWTQAPRAHVTALQAIQRPCLPKPDPGL